MADNKNLHRANKAKQDEFYTQLADIENELKHYKDHFKNKVVFCNCDDPYESNFFRYFAINFNYLKLKKLIATCYNNSPIAYTQLSLIGKDKVVLNKNKHPYKIEITEVKDYNKDGATDLVDVKYLLENKKNTLTILKEDGDFRSKECVELLTECDIVVTNPPFSLFREYVAQLIKYNKKFIIIGNKNIITYKDVFPLISSNKLWIGYKQMSGSLYFEVPNPHNQFDIIRDGKRLTPINACWFTNLDVKKRHEFLIPYLYKHYTPEEYPKYDNYDAINVDKVVDIPCDYYGVMGVPITFLDKYNPEEFEIVAFRKGDDGKDLVYSLANSAGGGIQPYFRILIRRI